MILGRRWGLQGRRGDMGRTGRGRERGVRI